MVLLKYFQKSRLAVKKLELFNTKLAEIALSDKGTFEVSFELCYNVGCLGKELKFEEKKKLKWVISDCFKSEEISESSFFGDTITDNPDDFMFEIGSRLNFSTSMSTNAVSICKNIGIEQITRIEISRRYFIKFFSPLKPFLTSGDVKSSIINELHDKMTECLYDTSLTDFNFPILSKPFYEIDIIGKGKSALAEANNELGLSFDDWDIDYYTNLFLNKVGRNPTSVECFDLAQSNSEHSRHWFFKGKMIINGDVQNKSLMDLVMETQIHTNGNSVIKFSDNSSALRGFPVDIIKPQNSQQPSQFAFNKDEHRDLIFTAETHNFPTGVAPFPGATTGTGGRIRDVQATGKGAHVIAGTAGYSFGNLLIPGYNLPWEDDLMKYPSNFASPLNIAIEASNGASDYGNKFGEPVICGFARSFGMILDDGQRREWIKPIMFSGGIGSIDAKHTMKEPPKQGMKVVKIGGPIYRIGVGGGAASSVNVQGDNKEELDFGAVQRGDAEMEQKLNRVIRACIEIGHDNPIKSIHDQGAGGNGNVLKEIAEPAGAIIYADAFELGDPSISTLELWGAEYQESNAVLIEEKDRQLLQNIGKREKVSVSVVGSITGDGKIVLEDYKKSEDDGVVDSKRKKMQHPVDLPLDVVLGKMPQKEFHLERKQRKLKPLDLPHDLTVSKALDRVLRLPSVASKRYLTNKVDRCVTGLIAQQQCVGPLHTPLADVGVIALSHFSTKGGATAIGEQPIKGLVDDACGARMTVGEALTNMVFANITELRDVKCSGNWMWAAKLPGEGARLYDACQSMCQCMSSLGVAIDGGKDSLSMAARVGEDIVKAPGTLVVSVYAPCKDIRKTVTPDLLCPNGKGQLLYVPLSNHGDRLGGSALAQVFGQIGDTCPDLDNTELFVKGFNTTQNMIERSLLTAGHDVSDGGLIIALLEMAFAGDCGIELYISKALKSRGSNLINILFAEELGLVIEVRQEHAKEVIREYNAVGLDCFEIGLSLKSSYEVSICDGDKCVLEVSMKDLRSIWESTSYQLEKLQANPSCVAIEEKGQSKRHAPIYKLGFEIPNIIIDNPHNIPCDGDRPKVAIIREEGSNGDREMASCFYLAGFNVWDVSMSDLCNQNVSLTQFRGIVFVGGFSYADVMGSAKGWAAVARFNPHVKRELEEFRLRKDTFSFGVCNGCQLMALLGWVGNEHADISDKEAMTSSGKDEIDTDNDHSTNQGTYLTHNNSERFECRFVNVTIEASPAIMTKGMVGSTLGIWIAHGEGKFEFKNDTVMKNIIQKQLSPMRYVNDDGEITMEYPLNPNGSPDGIASLCSEDGRHFALMPHPERCALTWQWPWMPDNIKSDNSIVSPWMKLFTNAFDWCQDKYDIENLA